MPTTTKQKLSAKIILATALIWICLAASMGPLLYAVYRLIAASHHPDGGFEGMAIMLMLLTQGFLLLFPLIGFMLALSWRRSLQDRLHELETGEPSETAKAKIGSGWF